MMIRPARIDDFDSVWSLAMRLHAESPFRDLPIDQSAALRAFVRAVSLDNGFAQVVEREGRVVGALVGVALVNHYGVLSACDLFCYSERDTHRLWRAFLRWGQARGVRLFQSQNPFNQARYGRLLTALGLPACGCNHLGVF